jgi:hypothetical protein
MSAAIGVNRPRSPDADRAAWGFRAAPDLRQMRPDRVVHPIQPTTRSRRPTLSTGTDRQALPLHLIIKTMCPAIVSMTENRSFGRSIPFDRDHLDAHWRGHLTDAATEERREVDLFNNTEILSPYFPN